MNKIIALLISLAYADSSVNDIISASKEALKKAERNAAEILDNSSSEKQAPCASKNEKKTEKACYSSLKDSDLQKEKTDQDQLLIFVSSSMSQNFLKELFKDAEKIGAKLIFRGLINNSFKETYTYFKETEINADIDPSKFDDYQVTVVPTFILTDAKGEQYDRLQGNVSIVEALTQFKDRGDFKAAAEKLLQTLGRLF